MTTNRNNILSDPEDHFDDNKPVNIYHGENPNNVVFEGGTTGEEPTTINDTMHFTEGDRGDDGIRMSSPTENTPETEEDADIREDGSIPGIEVEKDTLGNDFLGTNNPAISGMEGMGGHNFGEEVFTPSGNDKDNPSRTAGNRNDFFNDEPSEENAGPDSLKQ
ncbi:MAG: hypothetical protein ACOH2A_15130 [Sphingobacteriaceae bacterium]